jgi:hypothetical protein
MIHSSWKIGAVAFLVFMLSWNCALAGHADLGFMTPDTQLAAEKALDRLNTTRADGPKPPLPIAFVDYVWPDRGWREYIYEGPFPNAEAPAPDFPKEVAENFQEELPGLIKDRIADAFLVLEPGKDWIRLQVRDHNGTVTTFVARAPKNPRTKLKLADFQPPDETK